MIMMNFGWCRFGFQKGFLFGNKKNVPMWTLNIGLIKLQFISDSGSHLFREAVEGLSDDHEWMMKNHRSINAAVRRRCARDLHMADQEAAQAREKARQSEKENMRLRTEIHTLKRAIEIVQASEVSDG